VALAQEKPAQSAATQPGHGVIAVVLGKNVMAPDKGNTDALTGSVLLPLLTKYAEQNGLLPTDAEVDGFVTAMEAKKQQGLVEHEQRVAQLTAELKDDRLSADARQAKEKELKLAERILKIEREMAAPGKGNEVLLRPMMRQMARGFVSQWKVNKALYDKYGGRVAFQQSGVEPIDAWREFLKERQKNGDFTFTDKHYETAFWKYFTDDSVHRFYSQGDVAKIMATPFWLLKEP
jgi:hypothetical protein